MKLAIITITEREVEIPSACPECDEPTEPVRMSALDPCEYDATRFDTRHRNLGAEPGAKLIPYMVQCADCGHVLAGEVPR